MTNSRVFWTVSLAVFAAGVCLYFFVRWHFAEEKTKELRDEEQRLAALLAGRREIGFAAMLPKSAP